MTNSTWRRYFLEVAVGAIVLAASGCGGDAGDSPAPPPTAQPTALVVDPASANVTAGADGVALTATETGASLPVSWTLTGPGALGSTTGFSVNYTPPLPSELGSATSATITASVGNLSKTVTLALAPAPGMNWTLDRSFDAEVSGAYAFDGRFLAVTTWGFTYSSPDGQQWTQTSNPGALTGVAFAGSGYVAILAGMRVVNSADGVTWSAPIAVAPGVSSLRAVAAGGSRYVVAGDRFDTVADPVHPPKVGVVASSTDGVNWSPGTLPAGHDTLEHVAWGNGVFVADGNSELIYSTDGLAWTRAATGADPVWGIVFGNGKFLSYTLAGQAITSTDGITWTAASGGISGLGGDYSFSGGLFFATSANSLQSSADGLSWTPVGLPPQAGESISAAALDPQHIVATDRWQLHVLIDGAPWSQAAPASDLHAVDFLAGRYVAVGSGGLLMHSTDLRTWTTDSSPASPATLYGLVAGGGVMVAVGQGGVTLSSSDGLHWTKNDSGVPADLQAVTFAAGQFVATGANGIIITSPDGTHWTPRASALTASAPPSLLAVAHGAGRFVAVADDGEVTTSADGATWTSQTLPDSFLTGVAYGRHGFIALGGNNQVWTSPDGLTWSGGQTGTAGLFLSRLVSSHGQYVAIGNNGSASLAISEDGSDWRIAQVGDTGRGPVMAGLCACNGGYVAVGDGGAVISSGP